MREKFNITKVLSRNSKVLLISSLICGMSTTAYADEEEAGAGCAGVAAGVAAGVHLLMTQGETNVFTQIVAASVAGTAGYAALNSCDEVVEEVTQAYTEALNAMGIYVQWGIYHPVAPYCLSHDLDQCRPIPYGNPPLGEILFVVDSWAAVRDAGQTFTPGGSGGNFVSYQANPFANVFRNEAINHVNGPLSSYNASIGW